MGSKKIVVWVRTALGVTVAASVVLLMTATVAYALPWQRRSPSATLRRLTT